MGSFNTLSFTKQKTFNGIHLHEQNGERSIEPASSPIKNTTLDWTSRVNDHLTVGQKSSTKSINNLHEGRDKRQSNCSTLKIMTDRVIINLTMHGSFMKDRVMDYLNCTRVITTHTSWFEKSDSNIIK